VIPCCIELRILVYAFRNTDSLLSKMSLSTLALVGSLAAGAYAHGYVSGIKIGSKYYPGFTFYGTEESIGWSTSVTDNGFVAPDAFSDPDIICHRDATPAPISASVAAGSDVELQWNTWPDSHVGPVLDYLADCGGPCEDVDKTTLEWVKIDQAGYDNGDWAALDLIANNFSWTTTIPSDLAAGNYVLRHEIIALHSAGNEDGAQAYPQCVNLKVTGSGSTSLPSGTLGTKLYTEDEPGILVDIYSNFDSYEIPGPDVWDGASSGGGSTDTPAPSSEAPGPSSAAPTSAAPSSAPYGESSAAPATSSAYSPPSSAPAPPESSAPAPPSSSAGAGSSSKCTSTITISSSAAGSSSYPVSPVTSSAPVESSPVESSAPPPPYGGPAPSSVVSPVTSSAYYSVPPVGTGFPPPPPPPGTGVPPPFPSGPVGTGSYPIPSGTAPPLPSGTASTSFVYPSSTSYSVPAPSASAPAGYPTEPADDEPEMDMAGLMAKIIASVKKLFRQAEHSRSFKKM
jgi:hypothetical protein